MNFKKIVEETNPDIKFSVLLILIENSIGAFFHSIKIPLTGQILSINQISFLNKATLEAKDQKIPIRISLGVSLFKSLSPVGKKLTPMLGILMQGLLFNLPIIVFGSSYFSCIIASILSSLWAFIQPVILLYLFFGKDLYVSLEKIIADLKTYIPNIENYLLWAILIIFILKIIFIFIYSYLLIKKENLVFLKLESHSYSSTPKPRTTNNHFINALKDLFSPLFLFSFSLTTIYIYYQESNFTEFIWLLSRPLAIAFISFYIIRSTPIEKLSAILNKLGLNKFSGNLEKIKQYLEP